MAKVTQLVSGGVRAQIEAAWLQGSMLNNSAILLQDARELWEGILIIYLSIYLWHYKWVFLRVYFVCCLFSFEGEVES